MKRIISIILTLAMAVALCVPAFADAKSVLQTVKERIGDTEQYEVFESGSTEEEGGTVYRFRWATEKEDNYRTLTVSATDRGIITDYNEYRSDDWSGEDSPTLNRPSVETARETAESFFRKLNPTICDEFTLRASSARSLREREYQFTLQRTHDGIPVEGDTGYLSVTSDGSRVRNFWLRYTEGLRFEEKAGLIDRERAGKLFSEKIGMRLAYETDYGEDKIAVRLYYRPAVEDNVYLSALTGELITVLEPDYSRGGRYDAATATEEAKADNGAGASFSPAEQKELDNLAGLLSREEEERRIRATAILSVTADMKLESRNRYRDSFEDLYEDSLFFRGEKRNANVTVNAATGQILSFYAYRSGEAGTQDALTEQQATEQAKAAIKSLAGPVLSEYREKSAEGGNARYVRYVHDVPYEDDAVSASVDRKTGLLSSFRYRYHDVEFPSPDGVLSAVKASEKLLEQTPYETAYVLSCSETGRTSYDRALLVYRLTEGNYRRMDPFTGELEKWGGEETELPEYTDVSGHYAEKAILALRDFGIGFDTKEYRPDQTITQGEFLNLLAGVFFGYGDMILRAGSDYAEICDYAVRRGVLLPSDVAEKEPLTRDASAVFLIRAMGFDEVASLNSIYVCPFDDVKDHVGHVAILSAMGVFRGDGQGRFLPEKKLTRGDAAVVLYNYLTR